MVGGNDPGRRDPGERRSKEDHRGHVVPAIAAPARLLAAANVWCALTEARPHRPEMTEAEAAIAGQPGLSRNTVKRRVTHMQDKRGVTTGAGAAIHALETGLM